jgi:hypothetical protein
LGGLAEARLSFARKPRETLGVGGEELRKHLEGDVAIQPRVTGPIDLTLVAEAQSCAHATLPRSRPSARQRGVIKNAA